MSVFGAIKDAIFGKDDEQPAAPAAPTGDVAVAPPPQAAAPKPAPTAEAIDAVLQEKAAAHGGGLNYQESIVDLMKTLNLDSSLDNRKKLAGELGYTGDTGDSATMNIWLHGKVMDKLRQG